MSDINYKLKPDEIYITLIIKNRKSPTIYNSILKYTDGFEFNSVYKSINGVRETLNYQSGTDNFNIYYNDLVKFSGFGGNAIGFVTDQNNKTIMTYNNPEFNRFCTKIDYSHIIPQSKLNDLIFDPAVLNDPSLVSLLCMPRLTFLGGNATTNRISSYRKENPNFVQLKKDFLDWLIVIPPQDHPERERVCPFTDEQVFNAPYYKTQRLPSGSILLQMTEKTDFTKFDQVYWDKLIELYEYFVKLQD